MKSDLFRLKKGVIPACDVKTMEEFEEIIKNTYDLGGIVGYKVGCILGLNFGLKSLGEKVREYTDLPLIYDHQKAGTDIPQMGRNFAEVCKNGGIRGVILFPQAGPATERAFVEAIQKNDLVPLVGAHMTHPSYIESDGGFIRDSAPSEIYQNAARFGVDHFILPGNNLEVVTKSHEVISSLVEKPSYCMPGIGRQGGSIRTAFCAVENANTYAIVGSSIYRSKDIRNSAKALCKEALEFR